MDSFICTAGSNELLVFSNGKKAHPSDIESRLLSAGHHVVQACAFSLWDEVCVVTVAPEGATRDRVDEQVARANRTLPREFQIRHHIVADEAFCIGNGLLTTSLKLNRPKIMQMFFAAIFIDVAAARRTKAEDIVRRVTSGDGSIAMCLVVSLDARVHDGRNHVSLNRMISSSPSVCDARKSAWMRTHIPQCCGYWSPGMLAQFIVGPFRGLSRRLAAP
jgi:hypothetical protein